MGGGVVVWVVNILQIGLAVVLFQARVAGALLAYVACAIVSIGAYLWGLNSGGSVAILLFRPFDALGFFLTGTGNSLVGMFIHDLVLGPILWLDFLVGLVLIAIIGIVFTYYIKLPREEEKRSLVLICLIVFGLLEQALITYGRLPLGVSNAATARYATLTVIAPVAALIFLTLYADVSKICNVMALTTGSLILLFTIIGDRNELRIADGRHYLGMLRQKILLENKIGPEEQRILEWESLPDITEGNEILRKRRLSFYHGP